MKETKVSSMDKFVAANYPGKGVYRNTDDTGTVDIVISIPEENVVWSWIESSYNNILSAIKLSGEYTEEEPKPIKEEENKVSEDFALKAMALVMNKEKFSDVK